MFDLDYDSDYEDSVRPLKFSWTVPLSYHLEADNDNDDVEVARAYVREVNQGRGLAA